MLVGLRVSGSRGYLAVDRLLKPLRLELGLGRPPYPKRGKGLEGKGDKMTRSRVTYVCRVLQKSVFPFFNVYCVFLDLLLRKDIVG